jgi:altronate dehydratase small subunit
LQGDLLLKAIQIHEKDNVAVVTQKVAAGDSIDVLSEGRQTAIVAKTDVPLFHKVALLDIAGGAPIVKYGEHIGLAGCDIKAGEHVHVHNVSNHREDLSGVGV